MEGFLGKPSPVLDLALLGGMGGGPVGLEGEFFFSVGVDSASIFGEGERLIFYRIQDVINTFHMINEKGYIRTYIGSK